MTTIHYGCADCEEKDREIAGLRREVAAATALAETYRRAADAARFDALACADGGATKARELAFAEALHRLVPHVQFSGRIPFPDFTAYARVGLARGFDLYWAVDWILSGYPEPPAWTAPSSNGSLREQPTCGHPRQLALDGHVLPCAQPGCPHARGAGRYWRTLRLRRDLPSVKVERNEYVATPGFEEVEWMRSPELRNGSASFQFWIPTVSP